MSISLPIFSLLGWLEVNTSLWGEAAGCATAPRLWMIGSVQLSPRSRLRRHYGVIHNVTARAVNVAGNQIIMLGFSLGL